MRTKRSGTPDPEIPDPAPEKETSGQTGTIEVIAERTPDSLMIPGLMAEITRLRDLNRALSLERTDKLQHFEVYSTPSGWAILVSDPEGLPERIGQTAGHVIAALIGCAQGIVEDDPKKLSAESAAKAAAMLFDSAKLSGTVLIRYADRHKLPALNERGDGWEVRRVGDHGTEMLTTIGGWVRWPTGDQILTMDPGAWESLCASTRFPNEIQARRVFVQWATSTGYRIP